MSMQKEIIPLSVHIPHNGVALTGTGILKQAFDNNDKFLKRLSRDSILYWFRKKKGLPAPGEPYRGHFEENIKGQTAGLFLMGAANILRWREDEELRNRVDEIVDCIDACKESDGFIQPIPKSEFSTKEYPNYVRVWLNYGLKAAGAVGNRKALDLMRGMQSWFNRCDERFIARHMFLGFQGTIADVEVYFSDVGLPEDIDTTISCYQDNQWLGQLIGLSQDAIHRYTFHPHGTELEAITAYLDLYFATGKPMYLNAVNAAYRMFQKHWQHVGGGIVMIEFVPEMYPGCNFINPDHMYNELCCSAHWIYLNQRLHRLYPLVESYIAEIEASLYNIIVANQIGDEFIRYYALIDQRKSRYHHSPVSCCAGLGTRVLGSLPEFLYAITDDGISVDMYATSEIRWKHNNTPVTISMDTTQPTGGDVRMQIAASTPVSFAMHVRIPRWAKGDVQIRINGKQETVGKPGSYCPISRTWKHGDIIDFTIPMGFTTTRYTGVDKAPGGKERYAYEYGALLLGVVGQLDFKNRYVEITQDPLNPASWLVPVPGKGAHFTIQGKPGYEFLPYHEIMDEEFTCYPIVGKR